jgi:hypothetical protein
VTCGTISNHYRVVIAVLFNYIATEDARHGLSLAKRMLYLVIYALRLKVRKFIHLTRCKAGIVIIGTEAAVVISYFGTLPLAIQPTVVVQVDALLGSQGTTFVQAFL